MNARSADRTAEERPPCPDAGRSLTGRTPSSGLLLPLSAVRVPGRNSRLHERRREPVPGLQPVYTWAGAAPSLRVQVLLCRGCYLTSLPVNRNVKTTLRHRVTSPHARCRAGWQGGGSPHKARRERSTPRSERRSNKYYGGGRNPKGERARRGSLKRAAHPLRASAGCVGWHPVPWLSASCRMKYRA